MPVQVVVAEDHPIYRAGLRRALEGRAEIEVVGEARDGRQTLALLRAKRPQVALIDVRMPEPDGLAIVETISAESLPTRVVLLSAFVDGAIVHRALAVGAAGYLSKEEDEGSLAEAVLRAARGETVISEGLATAALEHVRQPPPATLLSRRESEVLRRIATGEPDREIAERLGVAIETIRTYRKRIYAKLDVSSAAAAVATAMRRGLLR